MSDKSSSDKIRDLFTNPVVRFNYFTALGLTRFIPDEEYVKIEYKLNMGKTLNLEHPVTYNEKTQWLKVYNHDPLYTLLVDKYEVKEIVSKFIDKKYIIPTLGCWKHFDDIDFSTLPNAFVLKCTHDSGGLVICKDKRSLNKKAAKAKIEHCLRRKYFYLHREWPYKNVPPRVIAEPYIEDNETHELRDYKIFCFDGVPKMLFVASDRQNPNEDTKFDFFDMDFNHINLRNGHPNAKVPPEKPSNFDEMKQLALVLSKGFPHVRVDFYEANGKTYFGEMTFFHWSGFVPFDPEEWDYKMGSWLRLPNKRV